MKTLSPGRTAWLSGAGILLVGLTVVACLTRPEPDRAVRVADPDLDLGSIRIDASTEVRYELFNPTRRAVRLVGVSDNL